MGPEIGPKSFASFEKEAPVLFEVSAYFLFGNVVLMIDFLTGETRADGRIKFTTDLTEVTKKCKDNIF